MKNRTGVWAILHYKSTKHIEIKIKRTHTVRKKAPYMGHPTSQAYYENPCNISRQLRLNLKFIFVEYAFDLGGSPLLYM